MLVGKRTDLLTVHANPAYEFVALEHWHDHESPCAPRFDERNNALIFLEVGLMVPKVRDMDNLVSMCEAFDRGTWVVPHIEHGIAP